MDIFPYRRNVLTFPTMKLRSTYKSISQYLIQNKNSEGTVLKLKTERKNVLEFPTMKTTH